LGVVPSCTVVGAGPRPQPLALVNQGFTGFRLSSFALQGGVIDIVSTLVFRLVIVANSISLRHPVLSWRELPAVGKRANLLPHRMRLKHDMACKFSAASSGSFRKRGA
jgi:hypothetical protein